APEIGDLVGDRVELVDPRFGIATDVDLAVSSGGQTEVGRAGADLSDVADLVGLGVVRPEVLVARAGDVHDAGGRNDDVVRTLRGPHLSAAQQLTGLDVGHGQGAGEVGVRLSLEHLVRDPAAVLLADGR